MTRRPRRRELMAEIAVLKWQVRQFEWDEIKWKRERDTLDAALEAERQWRLKGSVPALLAAEEKAQTWRAAALEAQAKLALVWTDEPEEPLAEWERELLEEKTEATRRLIASGYTDTSENRP